MSPPKTTMGLEHRISELEKELALSRSALSSFFVESPAGFALFDLNLRYTKINETIVRITGFNADQLLGKKPSEVLPQALANYTESRLLKVIATGTPLDSEPFSCAFPDRPEFVRHWQASHFPLRDEKGTIYGVGVVVVEVTDLHQARASLAEQEKFHQTLLESIPARIFIKDCAGRYLYCNDIFAADIGLAKSEIIGKDDFGIFRPEMAERYRQADIEVISSGKAQEFEYQFEKNGREFFIMVRKTPFRYANGNIRGILGIFQDLSPKRLAERQLLIRDHALAATQAGIAICDPSGLLTYANQACLKMWGFDRDEEVLGRHLSEFWPDPSLAGELARELNARGQWQGELNGLRKDASSFPALLTANLVNDAAGKQICMVSSFIDITARKTAEKRLLDSEEQLRQIAEHIDDALWVIDTSKKQMLYISPAYEKIWGLPRESLYRDSDL